MVPSAGYPMISHFTKTQPTTQGGFNLGGINATGQVITEVILLPSYPHLLCVVPDSIFTR